MAKIRLDIIIHERGYAESRAKAQAMIMAGEVLIDGQIADKAGMKIAEDANITVRSKRRYVSRGGDKLAGALTDFQFDASGLVCADVGASTGGFTDCLLQHGAKHVYAIDVGYGQIDYQIRQSERVTTIERTNARHLTELPQPIDLVVVDASFISLKLLFPAMMQWLTPHGNIIALIKPQFEAGKENVGKGGIVKDAKVHEQVLSDVLGFAREIQLHLGGLTISPIKGATGNTEFLVWLKMRPPETTLNIEQTIEAVMQRLISSEAGN